VTLLIIQFQLTLSYLDALLITAKNAMGQNKQYLLIRQVDALNALDRIIKDKNAYQHLNCSK
jgi:hypothetical protein